MTIRELVSPEDYAAAVELQRVVWGSEYSDVVPPVILSVAQKVGGIAGGAFGGSVLLGLIFGFPGFDGGHLFHWSDMMAVHPVHRDRGIGMRLKCYQRAVLLERGFAEARWTFDPLEARNAFINFSRLGGIAQQYVRDFYALSDSPLHTGSATDRLIVRWFLDSDRVRERLAETAHRGHRGAEGGALPLAPVAARVVDRELPLRPVNARVHDGGIEPADPDLGDRSDVVAITIPNDFQVVKQRDRALAEAWRMNTRAAFELCLGEGYTVTDFQRAEVAGAYILERDTRKVV